MSWTSVVVTRMRDVPWEQPWPPDLCSRFLAASHICTLQPWAVNLAALSLILLRLPARPGTLPKMPATRFEPSSIKNKVKREEIARKQKKEKRQGKLQRRLAQAKAEADDPLLKKVCLSAHMHSARVESAQCPITFLETSCSECASHPRQYSRV